MLKKLLTKIYFGFLMIVLILGSWGAVFERKMKMDNGPKSESWPTVQGKILRSEISRKKGSCDIRSSNSCGETFYEPFISYTYNVNGKTYESDRISFKNEIKGEKDPVAKKVFMYAVGNIGPVYYNPENPRMAILEKGWDEKEASELFILVPFAFLMSFCSLFILGRLVYGEEFPNKLKQLKEKIKSMKVKKLG
ncbi:MAG: DUF3592 domain-containing protein [Proteobacteria bacterium]|nr:DUF3592 domain-containing protein [Pseudomonadota bacterium]